MSCIHSGRVDPKGDPEGLEKQARRVQPRGTRPYTMGGKYELRAHCCCCCCCTGDEIAGSEKRVRRGARDIENTRFRGEPLLLDLAVVLASVGIAENTNRNEALKKNSNVHAYYMLLLLLLLLRSSLMAAKLGPGRPLRTAVPYGGQTAHNLTGSSPERDCGSTRD